MVNLNFDVSEVNKIALAAEHFKRNADKNFMKQALRSGLRPMLGFSKVEVPIGYKNKKSTLGYGRGKRSNERFKTYDRGGATKRDLRIKVSDNKSRGLFLLEAEVVGLVGVSKKREHVGWRTHFITRGTKAGKDRIGRNRKAQQANDFLSRAYKSGEGSLNADVAQKFDKKVQAFVNKINNG